MLIARTLQLLRRFTEEQTNIELCHRSGPSRPLNDIDNQRSMGPVIGFVFRRTLPFARKLLVRHLIYHADEKFVSTKYYIRMIAEPLGPNVITREFPIRLIRFPRITFDLSLNETIANGSLPIDTSETGHTFISLPEESLEEFLPEVFEDKV